MKTLITRYRLALVAFLSVALFAFQSAGAHADAVIPIPGGADGTTLTAALAPFVAIAAVAVLAVLGLKFAPLMVRYIFGWVKMALGRR